MEALQKTELTVYTEDGIPQLLYQDSNMFSPAGPLPVSLV